MTKQTKLWMWLGILSLIISPSVLCAQKYVKEGGAAIKAFSQTPKLTKAAEHAIDARNIQRGIAGARLITGVKATMPPLYTIPGSVPLSQQPVHIEIKPLSVLPTNAWGGYRTQLMDKYDLTTVDAQAVVAGMHNNLEAVVQAISHGAKPEMALFGALSQGNLALAEEIAEGCNVNINAPIFNNKTILESLPDFQGDADKRLAWLLEHGLNPDLVMTSGMYQQIKGPSLFKELVDKGLNPMAAFDKTKYTALHWYAKQYHKLSLKYDSNGDFLVGWVAKFPKTNVNAQDIWGNTPAHYVKAHTSDQLNAFARLRGFDPLIENKEGLPPENYQNGCTDAQWHHQAWYLLQRIESMIYTYKFNVLFPTRTQREFAHKKSRHYLHNPKPKELIEHFVALGATPQKIAETFCPFISKGSDDPWNAYSLRRDIVNVLYEEYGVTPPAEEPGQR